MLEREKEKERGRERDRERETETEIERDPLPVNHAKDCGLSFGQDGHTLN